MNFSGIEKNSLVDYDGYIACTLFTAGCNFRCPFCHNSNLVNGKADTVLDEEEALDFLQRRRGFLDAVCLTGGEPTLHKEIKPFLSKVKHLGYKVKLDTNGTDPTFLKELVKEGLIDYVAMDIKNSLKEYSAITGTSPDVSAIKESVEFLLSDAVDYEFRTTLVQGYHTVQTVSEIADLIAGAKRYFLQKFEDRGTVLTGGLAPVDKQTALIFKEILDKKIAKVSLRGY